MVCLQPVQLALITSMGAEGPCDPLIVIWSLAPRRKRGMTTARRIRPLVGPTNFFTYVAESLILRNDKAFLATRVLLPTCNQSHSTQAQVSRSFSSATSMLR